MPETRSLLHQRDCRVDVFSSSVCWLGTKGCRLPHDPLAAAEQYAQDLIARGHCPRCLVMNCECPRGWRVSFPKTGPNRERDLDLLLPGYHAIGQPRWVLYGALARLFGRPGRWGA